MESIVGRTAAALEGLRARAPRIHCITNTVAQNFTANVLLALGAVPSMTVAPQEVPGFVKSAQGLLVNLGTVDDERRASIPLAFQAAGDAGLGVVLDPVLANRSRARLDLALECLAMGPAIVRANAEEAAALSGGLGPREFAVAANTTLALTGPVDLVVNGTSAYEVRHGHSLMARITAMGCAASAVAAAFLAVEKDPAIAGAAALTVMGVAGEEAAQASRGPGSFVPAFLDTLYSLDAGRLWAAEETA
ncbi:hydroxyethylthiazole kinase [Stappia sp. F7233]|uniref:Hydroxyethylthiazole kinase n=1 Tax=Stappia albiluteola TaxID=2758565 RepID=A0A839AG36_9HYPH|nr:hydroxyethylthiazole kinase [Stappia albiluteola]MBA5777737.1 hydroxyethylthiazole kinase [Stappia albiluteola]